MAEDAASTDNDADAPDPEAGTAAPSPEMPLAVAIGAAALETPAGPGGEAAEDFPVAPVPAALAALAAGNGGDAGAGENAPPPSLGTLATGQGGAAAGPAVATTREANGDPARLAPSEGGASSPPPAAPTSPEARAIPVATVAPAAAETTAAQAAKLTAVAADAAPIGGDATLDVRSFHADPARSAAEPVPLRHLPDAMLARMQAAAAAPPPVPETRTEITLSPAELGRLTLTIRGGEDGIVVHVAAERPETMDLVRRHMDAFERAMTESGTRLRMELGDGSARQGGQGGAMAGQAGAEGQGRPGSRPSRDPQRPDAWATDPGLDPMPPGAAPNGRLDLRL